MIRALHVRANGKLEYSNTLYAKGNEIDIGNLGNRGHLQSLFHTRGPMELCHVRYKGKGPRGREVLDSFPDSRGKDPDVLTYISQTIWQLGWAGVSYPKSQG